MTSVQDPAEGVRRSTNQSGSVDGTSNSNSMSSSRTTSSTDE